MRSCANNPLHPIAADADPRRLFCSTACRMIAHRAREAARQEAALASLRAVVSAVHLGDRAQLTAAVGDADRLLRVEAVRL
jgi:hypothetical protein